MQLKKLSLIVASISIFLLPLPVYGADANAGKETAAPEAKEKAVVNGQNGQPAQGTTDFATMTDILDRAEPGSAVEGGKAAETGKAAEAGKTAEAAAPAAEPQAQPSEFDLMQQALSQSRTGANQEEFYHGCQYVTSQTLMSVLSAFISPSGKIAESAEADMVVISEVPENVEKLKRIIEEVDRPTPQVLVRAHIIELSKDYNFEKELTQLFEALGGGGNTFVKQASVTLAAPEQYAGEFYDRYGGFLNIQPLIQNYGGDRTNQLNTVLRYLEANGMAKLLASPNLIIRRNVQGEIHIGDQIPYEVTFLDDNGNRVVSTEYKNVGVYLQVVPIKIFGDTVRLFLKPEVSTFVSMSTNGQPLFNVRTASTQLDVKDGELLSIGGLYKNEERETERKVPFLGDLPFLGHFFTSTTKTKSESQLIFLFTTEILRPAKKNEVNIYRPDSVPDSLTEEISRQKEAMGITMNMDKTPPRPRYEATAGSPGLSIHHPRAIPDVITDADPDQPELEMEKEKNPIHTYESAPTVIVEPAEPLTDEAEAESPAPAAELGGEVAHPVPEATPEQELELPPAAEPAPEVKPAPEAEPAPVPEAEVKLTPGNPLSMKREFDSIDNNKLPVREPVEIDLISDLEQREFARDENNHFYADLPEVFQ